MILTELSEIRCTANPHSITSSSLIECADEIAAELNDAGDPATRGSIARVCDLPEDCDAITGHVVALIAHRASGAC
jgi:hypothetical protein